MVLRCIHTNICAHPLHGHHEGCPLVILCIDPVDLCSMGQRFCHVWQAASKWGPVELQTRAVLFGLIEHPLLTGWRRRQCGRHGHRWRLISFWKTKVERFLSLTTEVQIPIWLFSTCFRKVVISGNIGQDLSAPVRAVLDSAVCTLYCKISRSQKLAGRKHLRRSDDRK